MDVLDSVSVFSPLSSSELQICPRVAQALGEIGGKLFYVEDESEKLLRECEPSEKCATMSIGENTDRLQVEYAVAGGVTYPHASLVLDTAKPTMNSAAMKRRSALKVPKPGWSLGRLLASVRSIDRLHRWLAVSVPSTMTLFSIPADTGVAAVRRANSRIKAVAFHPHLFSIAVAVQQASNFGDVSIHIFEVAEQKWSETPLKHQLMTDVASMMWKPRSQNVLLVGCAHGFFMWSTSIALEESVHSGACVFYEFSRTSGVAATSLACTANGRFIAVGSTAAMHVSFFDISKQPCDALAMSLSFYDGPTASIIFSADDKWCIRSSSTSSELCVVNTVGWRKRFFNLAAPCEAIVPCWDRKYPDSIPLASAVHSTEPLLNHFVLQLRKLEGVLLARLDGNSGSLELLRVIVTGGAHTPSDTLMSHVGGAVINCAVSNRRLYVHLQRGHVLVCHLNELSTTICGEGGISLRPIAVIGVHPDCLLEPFHGFTKGSLLAVVKPDTTIHFIPSYHALVAS